MIFNFFIAADWNKLTEMIDEPNKEAPVIDGDDEPKPEGDEEGVADNVSPRDSGVDITKKSKKCMFSFSFFFFPPFFAVR